MRRLLLLAACVGLGGCSVLAPVTEILAPKPFFAPPSDLEAQMVAIEAETGGRLGAFVIDADGKSLLAYRADERFAMCSTFKTLLAAMVLEGVQQGSYDLDQPLAFDPADLVSYSPYVERYAAVGSVTLGGAAGAAVSLSDNSAANLLYDLVGGPGTLFQWLRTTGDKMSWPSRLEPDLNENAAGDMRDTTTPAAMGKTLHRLLTGNRLNNISKAQLETWLRASETGGARIRAGLPARWVVGDKTGTCGFPNPAYNDVAVVRPSPRTEPYVIAVYLDRPATDGAAADAAIAKVAALAASAIAAAR